MKNKVQEISIHLDNKFNEITKRFNTVLKEELNYLDEAKKEIKTITDNFIKHFITETEGLPKTFILRRTAVHDPKSWSDTVPGAYYKYIDSLGKKVCLRNNKSMVFKEERELYPGTLEVNELLCDMILSTDVKNRSLALEILNIEWDKKYSKNKQKEIVVNSYDTTIIQDNPFYYENNNI